MSGGSRRLLVGGPATCDQYASSPGLRAGANLTHLSPPTAGRTVVPGDGAVMDAIFG